jgi:hypothetical protein
MLLHLYHRKNGPILGLQDKPEQIFLVLATGYPVLPGSCSFASPPYGEFAFIVLFKLFHLKV